MLIFERLIVKEVLPEAREISNDQISRGSLMFFGRT